MTGISKGIRAKTLFLGVNFNTDLRFPKCAKQNHLKVMERFGMSNYKNNG